MSIYGPSWFIRQGRRCAPILTPSRLMSLMMFMLCIAAVCSQMLTDTDMPVRGDGNMPDDGNLPDAGGMHDDGAESDATDPDMPVLGDGNRLAYAGGMHDDGAEPDDDPAVLTTLHLDPAVARTYVYIDSYRAHCLRSPFIHPYNRAGDPIPVTQNVANPIRTSVDFFENSESVQRRSCC